MNSPRLILPRLHLLLLVPALLVSSHAFAQQVAPKSAAAAPDAKTLAKYDKNKNGKLDSDELATLQADENKDAKAPAANASADSNPGDVVTMSPFTVEPNDKGYAASNTLAGTRLNSKLEDIAGSVSVITKQQLLDTAAIDINDIFLYEVGTEGTGQFTDLSGDGRGDYDNVAGNPTGANRVRGLSAANIAVDGFSASSSIPIDTYNAAAVEISRGANSSLAGVGEAGGTVNIVQNRANLNRSTTSVTFRADSYDGYRSSISVNRPIIRNKLSVMFAAVYEEKGYVRKPSVDRNDRQTFGFTYKPFPKTTLSASYENVSEWARRANSVTPRDQITQWRANGSPTWDWTTRTFTVNGVKQAPTVDVNTNRPAGITTLGSSGVRVLQFIDDGKINYMMAGNNGNIQQFTRSTDQAITGGPLSKIPGTTDKSIYDYTEFNLAAPNYEIQDAGVATVRLEQGLVDTRRFRLTSEAAWRDEDQEIYQRSFVAQQDGVGNALSVDTNEYLLDGRKNPYLGRPFVGGVNPQVFKKLSYTETYRLQFAAQLDLTREKGILGWLGHHNANLYGEHRTQIRAPSLRLHDTIDAHPIFNPATNANGTPRALNNNNGALFYPLYYFGKTNGGGVEYGNTGAVNPTGFGFVASYPLATANPNSVYSIDAPVNIREAFFSAQTVQKKKTGTLGYTLQSFFLRDSIVATIGKRRDRVYTEDSLGTGAAVGGYTDEFTTLNFGRNQRWRVGDTDTKGVVVRPFKELPFVKHSAESTGLARFVGQTLQGLGVYYNESQNFAPADIAYNLYLQELPNPTGESKEFGISLNLFDRKLNLRVTHQETLQNRTRAGTGTLATRAMSIDFDIPGQNQNFDLLTATTGWLLELHPTWTPDQLLTGAAKYMGLTPEYLLSANGKTIADASDAKSTGTEVEVQFNPTRYWTVRMTGRQEKAVETNVSLFIQQFIAERRPIWENIIVPTELKPDGTQLQFAGQKWWLGGTGGGTPQAYFLGNVEQPVNIAIANQGKRKTQDREYAANIITRYQLAGLFRENKYLRNVSVGGSYRWASKAVIGYLGGIPDPDGQVRRLDRDKPIYDKATNNIDLLFTYNTRLFSDRIRANFQLNVKNVNESGRLQGVAVNPDGRFWQYRIIDPRQFILTASFDL